MVRYIALLAVVLIVGCTSPESPSTEQAQKITISPEAAKDAIVRLVAEKPGLFIGITDPAQVEELALADRGNGKWAFGVFSISLDTMTYSAMIGEDSPEPYLYEGEFQIEGDQVVAGLPKLTRLHKEVESL